MKSVSTSRILVAASLLAALVLLVVPVSGRADTLDFGLVPGTTSCPTTDCVSYAGGANPLVGTNIPVSNVKDLTTNVDYTILGGLLNFTSGNLFSSNANEWFFAGNNSSSAVTVTGCVDVDMDGGACDAQDVSGTLLNGSLTAATVTDIGGTFQVAISSFLDTKNAALLTAFGITGPNLWTGNFNLSFTTASVTPPNKFTSTQTLSGDLVNNQVPEPATLSLLGLGLLSAGWLGRKRTKKRPQDA